MSARRLHGALDAALRSHLLAVAVRGDGGGGRRGNPQLLPMESKNLDVSLEWYYDDASYASIGFWSKDVDNFIVNQTFENQPLFKDLYTPIDGDLYNQAVEALTGGDPRFDYDSGDLNEYYAENFADEEGVSVTGEGEDVEVVVTGVLGDPVAIFDVKLSKASFQFRFLSRSFRTPSLRFRSVISTKTVDPFATLG